MISCPVCAGPVDLVDGQPRCPMSHAFDQDDLPARVREEATRALWSAVRALEDTACAARWRLSQPDPAPHLQGVIDKATGEVLVLSDVLWRWRRAGRGRRRHDRLLDVHRSATSAVTRGPRPGACHALNGTRARLPGGSGPSARAMSPARPRTPLTQPHADEAPEPGGSTSRSRSTVLSGDLHRGDDHVMRTPRGELGLPLPARAAVAGAGALGSAGCATGLAIGWQVHPPTAWAAAAEIGIPSALLGGAIGLVAGSARLLAARRHDRPGRRTPTVVRTWPGPRR